MALAEVAADMKGISARDQISEHSRFALHPSVGMEVENDDFFGLMWSGFPLASSDRFDGSLSQDGMTAKGLGRFHGTVGKDQGFDFDRSGDAHFPGEAGIGRNDLCDYSALGLGLILLRARQGTGDQENRGTHSQGQPDPRTHILPSVSMIRHPMVYVKVTAVIR
jgi:hypothetical protein